MQKNKEKKENAGSIKNNDRDIKLSGNSATTPKKQKSVGSKVSGVPQDGSIKNSK